MVNSIVSEEQLKVWLNSKDSVLIQLAEDCIGLPLPQEQELINILTFFSIFNLGCKEMKEETIANIFEKRINLFVIGLTKMGFSGEFRKEYVTRKTIPGPLLRIKRRAFGRAAYVMTELKRYVEIKN
jgi:hypothetical protein